MSVSVGIMRGVTEHGQVVTLRLNEDGSLGDGSSIAFTASTAAIAASTNSGIILAANTNRKGATFYNDSTAIFYLKLGTDAVSNSFTTKLMQDDYYELPTGYMGVVSGVWNEAVGTLYVTELE